MNDKLKNLNDGGYNNLLVVVIFVVVVYLFVHGFNKSKQQTYLENAGLDKNTQLAQALKDAFNPVGVGVLQNWDFTDVKLVMSVAAQITDYKAVADAYRVLYNEELSMVLQQELTRDELQQFWGIVYKTTPTATPVANNSGKKVTAIATANIRVDAPGFPVEVDWLGQNKQAKAGDVLGTYVGEQVLNDIPNKGNRNVFVKYQSTFLGLNVSASWILKSAVKIG